MEVLLCGFLTAGHRVSDIKRTAAEQCWKRSTVSSQRWRSQQNSDRRLPRWKVTAAITVTCRSAVNSYNWCFVMRIIFWLLTRRDSLIYYVLSNFVDMTSTLLCWKHLWVSVTLLEWYLSKHSGWSAFCAPEYMAYKASSSNVYSYTHC